MNIPLRVLIVADSENTTLIARALRHGDYDLNLEQVDTPEVMSAALAQQTWDIVIVDHTLPQFNGLAALALLQESGLDLPVIVVSDTIGKEIAMKVMEAGAHDYVMKDNLARLPLAVRRELHEAKEHLARRQAEAALRESETQYRTTLDSMGDAIHVVDTELRLTLANAALKRWNRQLELEKNIIGLTVFQVYPFLPDKVRDEYHQVFDTGATLVTEETNRVGNRIMITETRKIPIFSEGGSVERVVTVIRDITEAKRAEKALRESEAHNRALLNAIPDLIFRFSRDGTYLDVIPSKDLEPVSPPTELIGKNVRDVLPPDIARQRMYCIEQALQSGEAQVHEYRLVENGVDVDYEARIVAAGDDQVLVIVRDITEQVQTEIEKNRLLARMQRQHAALVRLATHPALAEGLLEDAFRVIAEVSAVTLQVDQVNIWRLSPNKHALHCLEAFESVIREQKIGSVLPITQYPHYLAALEAGRVVAADDVRTDPRTAELTADCWEPQDIGASLSAPVRLHGEVVGLVCHDHRGSQRIWTPDEIAFASQVADLVTQAYLSADLRRRADEMTAITHVSREITSAPDLSQVFNSIARHAAELSQSHASGVFAFRADGRLYIEAGHGVQNQFIEAINAQGMPLGHGAIGQAAATLNPVQIPDILADPDFFYRHLTEMEQIRSVLAVPMVRDEQVIGGIVLWHRTSRHFSLGEITFLQALAQQCINAIENTRLLEAEARRRREAETLRAATQALSATLDLQRVFELILSELRQVVPYDSASVQQLKDDRMVIIGGHGFPNLEELLGVSFDLTSQDNPNQEMIRRRTPLLLDDVRGVYEEFDRKPHAQACIRSWLGVPLLFGDRLIGMIALDKQEPNFYTQEHARLAMAFAAQAAIAVENARLFAEEEQRAAVLARALERQQELSHLKSEFIQNVSHELRTPLAIARGYAELLDDGALGELQPEQRKPIATIARRIRMLTKLVDDLGAILAAETQELRKEPVDLANLVHNLVVDFQTTMDRAGLTLVAEVAPDLPPLSGDPTQLHRVLDNLLGNALKFTPAGGRIIVRLGKEDAALVLEVADTGVGIPADELEHIFERFYQIDGSMSRRYGGAGLGLALVKEIVEIHGGTTSVESQVGQGSTFRIRLPIQES